MVVMDKKEYIQKAKELLGEQQQTYKTIPADPPNCQKNRLINLLKTIKAEGGIQDHVYQKMYPTAAEPPIFHGLPKIHKTGVPKSCGVQQGLVT